MAIFRVEKTSNYTVMSNTHLVDKRLSYRAKGMLSAILCLPENWNYSIAGLKGLSTDGWDSTRGALKELENNGYLTRKPVKDDKGKIIDWEYTIYENPVEGYPQMGCPQMGKPQQSNTKKSNTILSSFILDKKEIINNNIDHIENKGVQGGKGEEIDLGTFCEIYGVAIDGYSAKAHDMDFAKLYEIFIENAFLRENFKSLSLICREYDKIIGGYYKQFMAVKEPKTANERTYTKEQLNGLITPIDEVEI